MLGGWRSRRALPIQCIAVYAQPLLERCAGYAKQSAAAAKASKASPAKVAAGEERIEGKNQKLIKLLEPKIVDTLELTPEQEAEYAQRAKEYSRRMMHEHRIWQADLSRKLQLKKAAIAALPEELQAAALVEDYSMFPTDRWIPTHTPPIANYEQQQRDRLGKGRRGAALGNKNQQA